MPDDNQTSSLPTTTEDAVKLFFPGQKISLKPTTNLPRVTFTIRKLSIPVTKSVVVLATPDSDEVVDAEEVVIKIYDPRYLNDRLTSYSGGTSYPWDLSIEQECVADRPKNSKMTTEEVQAIVLGLGEADESKESEADTIENQDGTDEPEDERGEEDSDGEDGSQVGGQEGGPEDSSEEDDSEYHEDMEYLILREEYYYRLLIEAYESELRAYERLSDLQGSAVPSLIMAGQFLPLDERAIQPPAIVFEYIPSISLFDIAFKAVTPNLRKQVLSIVESFPSYGVIHNDLNLTNIRFTPPERPVRAIVIDFGCSLVRAEVEDDEEWDLLSSEDVRWAKRMLEDGGIKQSAKSGSRRAREPGGRF